MHRPLPFLVPGEPTAWLSSKRKVVKPGNRNWIFRPRRRLATLLGLPKSCRRRNTPNTSMTSGIGQTFGGYTIQKRVKVAITSNKRIFPTQACLMKMKDNIKKDRPTIRATGTSGSALLSDRGSTNVTPQVYPAG